MKKILASFGIVIFGSFFLAFLYLISQLPKAPDYTPVKEIFLLPEGGEALKTETNQKRWRLYEAAKGDSEATVLKLLDEGVSGDIKDKTFGWTPLHWAVAHQNPSLVPALLKSGVEVNAKDNNLWTPLHEAVSNSDLKMTDLLLGRGADVNAEDINLWTPLHEAIANKDLKTATVLLKKGANVNKKDKNYWSPLELAEKQKDKKALDLLLKYNITFKLKVLTVIFLFVFIGGVLAWPTGTARS